MKIGDRAIDIRIIDRGITDRENVKHIKEIKESLNALEGGKVVDIWIDQSDKEKASSLYGRKETTEKFMLTQRPQVVN